MPAMTRCGWAASARVRHVCDACISSGRGVAIFELIHDDLSDGCDFVVLDQNHCIAHNRVIFSVNEACGAKSDVPSRDWCSLGDRRR